MVWAAHSLGEVSARVTSLFFWGYSWWQAPSLITFLFFLITCESFLQPWLYRSLFANFQWESFHVWCGIIYMGEGEFHILLLCHSDQSWVFKHSKDAIPVISEIAIISDDKTTVMQTVAPLYVMCFFSGCFHDFLLYLVYSSLSINKWVKFYSYYFHLGFTELTESVHICLSPNLGDFQTIISKIFVLPYSFYLFFPEFPLHVYYTFWFSSKSLMHFWLKIFFSLFLRLDNLFICFQIHRLISLSFPFCN